MEEGGVSGGGGSEWRRGGVSGGGRVSGGRGE